ncbi:hypothetical protein AXK12_03935 [Cephaloticoccus capnophilus]|uniref:TonB-dependent receptor plug domain-containing protein n=1 Tax=Cephaloticoccus capnophilus TaxID=1548208 RepID=A0A139SNH1_9BACT|nr:TonB-dependent receptor [Cephaloticoccus capnophilus]KXU36173.1 hypothetical protein AXK12_03935 [Cephaloticoccus capnophilus]
MLALAVAANVQQAPAQNDEEIVRLSPFSINESANIGRYQAVEATSGTRVRVSLMESTQSLSVLTNEFLTDVGTDRLLDAVKYVAGIGEAGNPGLLDAMNIRGFDNYGATMDGFSQFNWTNLDPIVVERIEVVKGPNAIIAPAGLPGGVVNNITKRPLFTNRGYISYQVGRWGANRAELDANYVVQPDKLAVRVVGAFTDADDYGRENFHQSTIVMPMLTYRLGGSTELTLQAQAYNTIAPSNGGTPLSLYAVNRSNIRILDGLPRDFMLPGRPYANRQNGEHVRLSLTSQITDKLSMRLAGSASEINVTNPGFGASLPNVEVIKLDQITGEWSWDGVTRNDSPTYTLGGFKHWVAGHQANFQNDFVYEHTATSWKSQTVVGYAFNYHSQSNRWQLYTPNPTNYDFTKDYTPPGYTLANWLGQVSKRERSSQVYLYQVARLFEDRLVLSGSLSQNRSFSSTKNNLNRDYGEGKKEVMLPSGGIVYNVTPAVSLYYGFSKQETLGNVSSLDAVPPLAVPSRQHEGGIRLKLFDGRLYATLAYFDIVQSNVWSSNPENFITPIPDPPLPSLFADRTAKGVEFEFAWSPTQSLSFIGSFTDYKNRDQDDMPYSNVAERMAAIWGSYTFSEGPLRGLRVGLGASYTGERAGDVGPNFTTPPSGFAPVRIQPSFWVPSYTVVEASASYRFGKHWQATLAVKNLLDRDYIQAAAGSRSIFVSVPINPKLTVRYDF